MLDEGEAVSGSGSEGSEWRPRHVRERINRVHVCLWAQGIGPLGVLGPPPRDLDSALCYRS